MTQKRLSHNIKSLRKALGLTQEELAKKVDYSDKSMICKIEAGNSELPLRKLPIFAQALGVSPAELMGWGDDEAEAASTLSGVAIPVYDEIFFQNPEKQMMHIVYYETIPSSWKGEYFGLLISEQTYAPLFESGDVVILRKQMTARSGSLVLALNRQKHGIFRRLLKTQNKSYFLPVQSAAKASALAEASHYDVSLRIIGCVVETRRKY